MIVAIMIIIIIIIIINNNNNGSHSNSYNYDKNNINQRTVHLKMINIILSLNYFIITKQSYPYRYIFSCFSCTYLPYPTRKDAWTMI